MKTVKRCALLVFACMLLAGCVPGNTGGNQAIAAYQQVLDGSRTLVYEGQTVHLSEVQAGSINGPLRFSGIALVDVDADEAAEVVIAVNLDSYDAYGSLVLHWEDGIVYGYDFVYRAMMNLKADGTFSFSSGAADSGFGRASFQNGAAEIVSLAYSEMLIDGSIQYHLGDETVSEDAFLEAILAQDEKADDAWYAYTDVDLCAIAEGRASTGKFRQ